MNNMTENTLGFLRSDLCSASASKFVSTTNSKVCFLPLYRKVGKILFCHPQDKNLVSARTFWLLFKSRSIGKKMIIRSAAAGTSTGNTIHSKERKIAIVGGGLAGLATAYHILAHELHREGDRVLRLVIYDPEDPGCGGGSAAAAGLLHPYSPRLRSKCWNGDESFEDALALLNITQEHALKCNMGPIFRNTGLLRLALSPKHQKDFKKAVELFPSDLQWWDPEAIRKVWPHVIEGKPGVFSKNAKVVDTPKYLRVLWSLCQTLGDVEWMNYPINDVGQLCSEDFNDIIVTAGIGTKTVRQLWNQVPISACRGQNVNFVLESRLKLRSRKENGQETDVQSIIFFHDAIVENTSTIPPLISGKYIIPNDDGSLFCGATFEYLSKQEYMISSETPDIKLASKKLHRLFCAPTDIHYAESYLRYEIGSRLLPDLEDSSMYHPKSVTRGVRALTHRVPGQTPSPIIDLVQYRNNNLEASPSIIEYKKNMDQISEGKDFRSIWVFTGLGSRGLLHHAVGGKILANAILTNDASGIPEELRRCGEYSPEQNFDAETQ